MEYENVEQARAAQVRWVGNGWVVWQSCVGIQTAFVLPNPSSPSVLIAAATALNGYQLDTPDCCSKH